MDDLEMEEWMAMTEEEQNTALEVANAEYTKWWNSLSAAQQIKIRRGALLESCLTMRRGIKLTGGMPMLVGFLKARQMSLVKIRAWRATGHYPGTA